MSLFHHILHIKMEVHFFTAAVEVVEDAQSLPCVQLYGFCPQGSESCTQLRTHTGKVGSGFGDVLFANGYGHIFLLDDTISSGCLVHNYAVVLFPEMV